MASLNYDSQWKRSRSWLNWDVYAALGMQPEVPRQSESKKTESATEPSIPPEYQEGVAFDRLSRAQRKVHAMRAQFIAKREGSLALGIGDC